MSDDIVYRSDMDVELIRAHGSDTDVVYAARVSTQGQRSIDALDEDPAASAGLISYLMRERHGSPFEHNSFTFFVRAPIFVFREFQRHRIASYNEESGRYKQLDPVFYVPDRERKLVQEGKPGAYTFAAGSDVQFAVTDTALRVNSRRAYRTYVRLLEEGVTREVARMVLPLNIYSSMYVTLNARALMNFLSLRTEHEDALFTSRPQHEIQLVADEMERQWSEHMPLTYEAFVKSRRVAP